MRSAVITLTIGALALGAVAAAQTSTTPTAPRPAPTAQADRAERDDITVVGCVEKNKSGGFWLTNAMHSDARRGDAGVSTQTQRSSSSAPDSKGMVYNLEDGKDLDSHVGHRMEFTGRADDTTSSDQLKGTTGDREIRAQDFHVSSQRMVEGACSQR